MKLARYWEVPCTGRLPIGSVACHVLLHARGSAQLRSVLGGALASVVLALAACSAGIDTPPVPSTDHAAVSEPTNASTSAVVQQSIAPATAAPSTLVATTTTETTTTTTTLPPITVGFAGDTSFTHGLDGRDPLGDVADELSTPDVMVLNLETTVAEADVGSAIEKRFTFKSPPVTGRLLAEAGVDVAALANNHALDYGPAAVVRTIEILGEAGVATAGTGRSRDEAYEALRLDVSGWDLAILSFSRVPCDAPEPGESYIEEVAWACPQFDDLTIGAVAAAADADFTVVMVHWGIQREVCPAQHQRQLAASWIEAGADAIVGSHPHVLQGVEQIDGAWVVHSTGNFAFPSARNASSYSAMFVMTIGAGVTKLEAIPIRIEKGRPVLAIASREGILDDLTHRSFGYTFGEDGSAVPSVGAGSCEG